MKLFSRCYGICVCRAALYNEDYRQNREEGTSNQARTLPHRSGGASVKQQFIMLFSAVELITVIQKQDGVSFRLVRRKHYSVLLCIIGDLKSLLEIVETSILPDYTHYPKMDCSSRFHGVVRQNK